MAAKQDPAHKGARAIAADGKTYFSYAQVHEAVSSAAPAIQAFKPDVMVAIGGGGFIPARMLRTELKVPILAVSLELYDDATKTANVQVIKKQWFDETSGVGKLVCGRRVLVVDEVDDTRATLQYCIEELMKSNAPAEVATFCVFNKLKPKKGVLPAGVKMFVGADIPDKWSCFPWDAAAYGRDIRAHEKVARWCAGEEVAAAGSHSVGVRAQLALALAAGCALGALVGIACARR
ncbi:hypothetical protein KFE25_002912 [Diacronema lutheri]|uniref:Phosphoribosyltransferase domain-containing protein n=3 Tax=Diacronema lutheri TaxID=2081491 RepID=A0A8J6CD96_DIALT|nr:hypothetical protein KFE25_002912 [Diacronema lutheri]